MLVLTHSGDSNPKSSADRLALLGLHHNDDSCSDVINEVPSVYTKNTDMEPDSEEVIIDTGKSIGNAQTVSETVSEGFKGEDQQSQPNLE